MELTLVQCFFPPHNIRWETCSKRFSQKTKTSNRPSWFDKKINWSSWPRFGLFIYGHYYYNDFLTRWSLLKSITPKTQESTNLKRRHKTHSHTGQRGDDEGCQVQVRRHASRFLDQLLHKLIPGKHGDKPWKTYSVWAWGRQVRFIVSAHCTCKSHDDCETR